MTTIILTHVPRVNYNQIKNLHEKLDSNDSVLILEPAATTYII